MNIEDLRSSEITIGITLSGGGARGITHLGVLQALEESGIKPCRITGSSAGAIVGALYAAGHRPATILELITKTKLFNFFKPARSFTGLLQMDKTRELFLQHLPSDSFESLQMPLTVCTTDIESGEAVFFSRGELIKPLQASSCIPVIFSPIEIEGRFYIDGGITNNLPVEPLLGLCDFIVGVHSNAVAEMKVTNVKQIIERTLLLAINTNIELRRRRCDLFIEPPGMSTYSVYDVAKAKEIFDVGYKHTKEVMQHLVVSAYDF